MRGVACLSIALALAGCSGGQHTSSGAGPGSATPTVAVADDPPPPEDVYDIEPDEVDDDLPSDAPRAHGPFFCTGVEGRAEAEVCADTLERCEDNRLLLKFTDDPELIFYCNKLDAAYCFDERADHCAQHKERCDAMRGDAEGYCVESR